MPITITPTPPHGVLTPGGFVTLQSDFVGPLPGTASWSVQLLPPAPSETAFWTTTLQDNRNPVSLPILVNTQQGTLPGTFVPALGDDVRIEANLFQSPTVEIDTGVATLPWDPSIGLGSQIELKTQASASGGLTPEEHGWLDQVVQFVQNTLTFGGTIASQLGAGGLIDHPDLNLMSQCGPAMTLNGTGVLTRPRPGVGVEAYGLTLNVAVSPPGAGLLGGAIREFSARPVQLVAFYKSATSPDEYPVEIFDMRAENDAWLWRNPFPSRIVYSTTPGFEVIAQWLCLPVF